MPAASRHAGSSERGANRRDGDRAHVRELASWRARAGTAGPRDDRLPGPVRGRDRTPRRLRVRTDVDLAAGGSQRASIASTRCGSRRTRRCGATRPTRAHCRGRAPRATALPALGSEAEACRVVLAHTARSTCGRRPGDHAAAHRKGPSAPTISRHSAGGWPSPAAGRPCCSQAGVGNGRGAPSQGSTATRREGTAATLQRRAEFYRRLSIDWG